MATPLATAFVRIRPDTSTFEKESKQGLQKAGRGLANDGRKQGRLFGAAYAKGSAGPLRSILGTTGVAAAGIATAGIAIAKFGKSSIDAFKEAQQSQTQLEDAFKRFPKLANENIESFRALNTQLAKKTRFDDDAYASGQAILAQFRLTGDQIKQVTPLLGDYAAKTGRDVPTAAKLLGKASLGNTRALKELGINFKATGDQGKDMATVVALLQQRVGGFAEKEGKTAAGQTEILKNQFGELQEDVGQRLLPALLKLLNVGLKLIDWIQRNSKVLGPLVAIVGTFVVTLLTLNKAIVLVSGAMRLMGLSSTIALGPIGLIIAAIAALAVGLVIAYKKSQTFRDIVNGVFKSVAKVFTFLWKNVIQLYIRLWVNAWLTLVGVIVNGAAKAFGWVPGLGGKLKNAAKQFNTFKNDVNRALGGIDDEKVNVITGIKLPPGVKVHEVFGKARTRGAFATGGLIPGSPSSRDNRVIGAATGEFVVNAAQTRRFLPLLQSINQGFAQGGLVVDTHFPAREQMKALAGYIGAGLRRTGGTIGRWLKTSADNILGGLFGFGGAPGNVSGNAALVKALAASLYGWAGGQWNALFHLIQGESGFRNTAQNPTSSAYGMFQFLDGTWASVGGRKTSDPRSQAVLGLRYIASRYGSPAAAYGAWLSRVPHWYGTGTPFVPETGPAILHRGERVVPANQNRGGFGNTYNINFYPPPGMSEAEAGRVLVQKIKAYERGSGSGWRK